MTGSNYPPGVTGFELEIAGPDYETGSDELCEVCGGQTVEWGYGGQRWLSCETDDPTHQRELEPEERPA